MHTERPQLVQDFRLPPLYSMVQLKSKNAGPGTDLLNPRSAYGGTLGGFVTSPIMSVVTIDRPRPSGKSAADRTGRGHPDQALVVLLLNVCGIRQKANEITKVFHERKEYVSQGKAVSHNRLFARPLSPLQVRLAMPKLCHSGQEPCYDGAAQS